jgi:hypothetical protein
MPNGEHEDMPVKQSSRHIKCSRKIADIAEIAGALRDYGE